MKHLKKFNESEVTSKSKDVEVGFDITSFEDDEDTLVGFKSSVDVLSDKDENKIKDEIQKFEDFVIKISIEECDSDSDFDPSIAVCPGVSGVNLGNQPVVSELPQSCDNGCCGACTNDSDCPCGCPECPCYSDEDIQSADIQSADIEDQSAVSTFSNFLNGL